MPGRQGRRVKLSLAAASLLAVRSECAFLPPPASRLAATCCGLLKIIWNLDASTLARQACVRRLASVEVSGMRREFLILVVAVGMGCSTPVHTVRFHEEVPGNLPASRVRRVTVPHTDQTIGVNPFPSLSEKDVDEARLELTNAGDAVLLKFDAHGAVALAEMTTRLRGNFFVVFVDERPVVGLRVERAIKDGQFLLLGDLTEAQAKSLVQSLNKQAGRWRDSGDTRLTP